MPWQDTSVRRSLHGRAWGRGSAERGGERGIKRQGTWLSKSTADISVGRIQGTTCRESAGHGGVGLWLVTVPGVEVKKKKKGDLD